MYDAIVVGASCAGSPTAMLLARRGYRVLLVDKSNFPRDILSTHYIHQPGVERLNRWGLLQQVRASNCPPVRRLLLDFGPVSLKGTPPPARGVREAYAPRRFLLDKLLCDAACQAGAELRQGFTVEEVLTQGRRVVGIRGRTRRGSPVTEKAKIVIGAEGRYSLVARTVQAPCYRRRPVLNCSYYSYFSGVAREEFEFYQLDRMAIVVIPTNDGLACIWIGWKPSEFARIRANIEKHFMRAVDLAPHLAERVRSGRRAEPFAGTAGLPNYFRKPYGPGWALVGDAGYLKDPATGQGITDAFRDSELLAEALDLGLSGQRPLQRALADYERRRNKMALPIYNMVCRYAALDPPPALIMQFLAGLEGDQIETDRLAGTVAGTVCSRDFYSPWHLAAVLLGRLGKKLRSARSRAGGPGSILDG